MQIQVLPSLLAADFGNLREGVHAARHAGADALHLDIMDGHFVPNLSMGPDVVAMARDCAVLPLSVHLMMTHPDQYVLKFIEAGASTLHIHIEAECDVPHTLRRIREQGVRPGITLNPETPAAVIFPVIDAVDEVLCMSVHPGYGGQSFMDSVLPKLREIRDFATARGRTDLSVMVDGGIDHVSAPRCAAHGANAFVAGTSLYGADNMGRALEALRAAATDAFRA